MKENKVLVILSVPEIDETYDLLVPIDRKIGNIIELFQKFLLEITEGNYKIDVHKNIYNSQSNQPYDINSLLIDTDIRNGTKLILL